MKRRKVLSFCLTAVCVVSLLSGCGASGSGEGNPEKATSEAAEGTEENSAEETASGEHEPITIGDYNRDYTKLIELVHEKYPEINVQIEPYKGSNTTGYMKKQLETGRMPDIYVTTQAWDEELQKKNLVDLSKYPVSELYNQVRLNEYDVDGGIYLLPYDYVVLGIQYNKHCWRKTTSKFRRAFSSFARRQFLHCRRPALRYQQI